MDVKDKVVIIVPSGTVRNMLDYTKSCEYLFADNHNITDLTKVLHYDDTTNVTNMYGTFKNCSSLKAIPSLNTKKVTTMKHMCYNCSSMTKFPKMETPLVTNMNSLFGDCVKLEEIESLDLNSVTDIGDAFFRCNKLKKVTLKNIRKSMILGVSGIQGDLLEIDSLINIIGELIASNGATLTIGNKNIAKLNNVWVKELDWSGDNSKYPFTETTVNDPNGLPIIDYVLLKSWNLA